MSEFFTTMMKILMYPPMFFEKSANALNAYDFNQTLLSDYLSYMHYAMGTPIFVIFTSVALIAVTVSIWSLIVKGLAYLMEIIPFV